MKKIIFTLLLLVLDASMEISVLNVMESQQEYNQTVLCHSDSEDEIEENNQRLNFFSELKTDQDDGIRSIEFGKNFTFHVGEHVLVRNKNNTKWNQGSIMQTNPEVLVKLMDENKMIGYPWQYIKKVKVRDCITENLESSDSEEIEEKDYTQSNHIALKQELYAQNLANGPAIRKQKNHNVITNEYIDLFNEEINGIGNTNNTFEANKMFTDLESQFQRKIDAFHLGSEKEDQNGKKEKRNRRNVLHSKTKFSFEDKEQEEMDDEPIKQITKQIEELEKANILKREMIEEIKEAKNLKRKRDNKLQKKILKKITDQSNVSTNRKKERIKNTYYGEQVEHVNQEFNQQQNITELKSELPNHTQTATNNANNETTNEEKSIHLVEKSAINRPAKMISVLKQLPEEGDDAKVVSSFKSQNGIHLHIGDIIKIISGFIGSVLMGQVKSTGDYVHVLKNDYDKLMIIDKNVCGYCKQQTIRDYLLASKRSNFMLCAACWQYEYKNKKLIPRNERVSQSILNNKNKKSTTRGIYSESSKYKNIYYSNAKKKYQCMASIKLSGSNKFGWKRIYADINEDYCAKRAKEIVKARIANGEYQSVRNDQNFATLKQKKVTICEYCKLPSSTQRLVFSARSKLKLCHTCDIYERKYNRLIRYMYTYRKMN